MQQSDKISILETVAFVRGSAHIIRKFAQSKLDVFFSRAILAAENKPSLKFDSRTKYQFWRLPNSCAEGAHTICDVCRMANSSCF